MSQHDRYLELRVQVEERFERVLRFADEEDVTEFWTRGTTSARKLLLPFPIFGFMGRPGLRGRMGTDLKKYTGPKQWLDENYDRRQTKAALVVDEIGGVPTTTFLGRKVNTDVIKFVFYASLLAKTSGVALRRVRSVLDWGGGYGGQAKIFKRMGDSSLTYTIADIPSVCVLQWLYLSVLFGEDAVNLISTEDASVEEGKINIIPSALVLNMSNEALGSPQMFISTNALNECPASTVRTVVEDRGWFGVEHIMLRVGGSGIVPDNADTPLVGFNLRLAGESFGKEDYKAASLLDTNIVIGSR